MAKFVVGPTFGIAAGLGIVETALLTGTGMMASVVIFSYGGQGARDWWFETFRRDRKLFSPKNRKMVKLYVRWRIQGIAFLTPVIFSPIVGTLLAVSFGETKIRIIRFMALAAFFWAFTLSSLIWLIRNFFTNSL